MSEPIKIILSLSVSGGLFALVLFILKPFMRNRLSKSFQYYIWLVVLLRFIVPFSFGINLMDLSLNAPSVSKTSAETVIPNNPTNPSIEFQEREYTIPYTPGDNVPKGSFMVIDPIKILAENLLWIWLAGAVISAAWNILGYLRFIRYVRGVAYAVEMPDCGVKVYKSRFAPTPMLVGIIRPRLYLSDIEYTNEQLNNILLHELTHLRRRDVWLKWFAALVVSAHWFNPIAYLMRREFNRACELSCDEAVIQSLDSAAKQSYGDTLISVVAESRYPVGVMSVTMCEEKKKLKERLVAIMNYKKKTKIAVLITVVLAVVITGSAFAFGAQGSGFTFWKTSVYSIDFPYERASEISAEDITALILNKINTPKADIYMYTDSQNVDLNLDYTLMNFTATVLISEYKDNALVHKPYQIRIFPDGKNGKMNIFPYDRLLTVDTNQGNCSFIDYWDAIINLPVEAIENVLPRETPSFYSFEYTKLDPYKGALPKTNFIFFNKEGAIDEYKGTPSVIFIFWAQYQIETNKGHFSGINTADLYYYADRNIKIDSVAVDYSYDISLADLRQLAAKGDELIFEDFSKYNGQEVGSGLYILYFKIESGYELFVAAGFDEKPMYATLQIPGVEESIDVRYDDIDEFIGKYHVPNELSGQIYGYLNTIISSPSLSSATGDYIKAHQTEYNTIVNMGVVALPTLKNILDNGDMGLRGNITWLLVQDIIAAESGKPQSEWLNGYLYLVSMSVRSWASGMGYSTNDSPAIRDTEEMVLGSMEDEAGILIEEDTAIYVIGRKAVYMTIDMYNAWVDAGENNADVYDFAEFVLYTPIGKGLDERMYMRIDDYKAWAAVGENDADVYDYASVYTQ